MPETKYMNLSFNVLIRVPVGCRCEPDVSHIENAITDLFEFEEDGAGVTVNVELEETFPSV